MMGISRQFSEMKKFPHEGVYARLMPSTIHGVGVYVIRDIPYGTYVFGADRENVAWVKKDIVEKLPEEFRKLYEDFCVLNDDEYGCPKSFNKLTTSWYINHSKKPNMTWDASYVFFAARNIKKGEELTVDYDWLRLSA